jgi:hypothetical protein
MNAVMAPPHAFLVHDDGHADAAVRVAAARERAPVGRGPCTRSAQSLNVPMNEIGNQSRDGSPMPVGSSRRAPVRERVALRRAALVRDFFVTDR